MNATLPIFSLDVSGQPAPIGSIPGSGEEAFADSLNAALAATAQQDATSVAQQQAEAREADKGALTNNQDDAGALASGESAVSDATPSVAGSEIGTGAELAVNAAALQAQHANRAAQIVRSDDAVIALRNGVVNAGIDQAEAADAGSLSLLNARQTQTAPLDAAARQATAASVQGLQVAGETGAQPTASSALTSAAEEGRGQPAGAALLTSSDRRMLDRAIRENVPTAPPSPSASPAGTAAEQALPKAHLAGSALAIASGQSLASADQSSAEGSLDLQQSVIKANGEMAAGAARGVMLSSVEPTSPIQRQSAAGGHVEPANHSTATGLFASGAGTAADPNRIPPGSPNPTQSETALAAANQNAGKSGTATTLASGAAGSAAAQLAAEAGQHQHVDASGFDQVQPPFSADASAQSIERLEPGSSIGGLRGQAQAAYVPAGTQVALQIVRSMPNGVDRLSVHLQPAELGSVDIQLSFESAGRVSALITAERPETLEMLQRDSRLLERSLGDSGLKLSSDGLSFGLKQDQQQQHGQGFQGQAQDRQAAIRAGRAYDDTSDTAGPAAPGIAHARGLRLLDIET